MLCYSLLKVLGYPEGLCSFMFTVHHWMSQWLPGTFGAYPNFPHAYLCSYFFRIKVGEYPSFKILKIHQIFRCCMDKLVATKMKSSSVHQITHIFQSFCRSTCPDVKEKKHETQFLFLWSCTGVANYNASDVFLSIPFTRTKELVIILEVCGATGP